MKQKNLLVSGCSYTHNQTWPEMLIPNSKITNLGISSAGNEYIANSIIYQISKNNSNKPDFVFMLFSGINRIDLKVPKTKLLDDKNILYKKEVVGNSEYFLSGHAVDVEKGWLSGYNNIKDPSWPTINSILDWHNLPMHIKQECVSADIHLACNSRTNPAVPIIDQYFVLQYIELNQTYLSERSFQNIMNVCNFLQVQGIEYRFAFIYDIWKNTFNNSLGQAVKETFYKQIDWTKFIDFPPFEYGIRHNLLSKDNFHLTKEGMNQWASEIRKKF